MVRQRRLAVPLETSAKASAERLLLLTEAMIDAVARDRPDELNGLLDSRQKVIDQLATMDIDSVAAAVLELATKAERRLLAEMRRSQAAVTRSLIETYARERKVRALPRRRDVGLPADRVSRKGGF